MIASECGKVDIVRHLISRHSNVNATTKVSFILCCVFAILHIYFLLSVGTNCFIICNIGQ